MMDAVACKNITKVYGKKKTVAVDHISFTVNKGELFGLIGPDGAGKTSIFRMLTTLLLPDGGTATVDGFDIVKDYKQIRKTVGYMPGKFSLYPDLTVEENLKFFATLFGTTLQQNYALIKEIYVQIEPFKKRKAGQLSGGMKQKLALCCALIHQPTVLFLDEPTTGVDAVSRKEFWEMLKRLKAQGITIVVSTPYMDEAGLCDRVALMQEGWILAIDTPDAIRDHFGKPLLAIRSTEMHRLLKDLRKHPAILSTYAFGGFHHAVMQDEYDVNGLKQDLARAGHKDIEVIEIRPDIEDAFMQLMHVNEEQNHE